MSLTESEMIRLILYVKYRAWVRIVLAILAYLDWKQGETAWLCPRWKNTLKTPALTLNN